VALDQQLEGGLVPRQGLLDESAVVGCAGVGRPARLEEGRFHAGSSDALGRGSIPVVPPLLAGSGADRQLVAHSLPGAGACAPPSTPWRVCPSLSRLTRKYLRFVGLGGVLNGSWPRTSSP